MNKLSPDSCDICHWIIYKYHLWKNKIKNKLQREDLRNNLKPSNYSTFNDNSESWGWFIETE